MGEPLAQLGRGVEVIDRQQRVVVADIADAAVIELTGQPLAAVDVDLALIRDPPLDPNVHEPELVVDQIQVVVQALPLPAEQLQLAALVPLADLEAEARLHRADQTDDPLGDPVALGDRLGQLVFVLGAVAGLHMIKGDHRPPRVGDQLAGVVGDPLRRRLRVGGEVLQRDTLGPQEAAGPVLLVQTRQMTLEDHPIEHRQTASDPIPMKILERTHNCTSTSTRTRQVSRARCKGTGPAPPARHRPDPPPSRRLDAAERAQRARLP